MCVLFERERAKRVFYLRRNSGVGVKEEGVFLEREREGKERFFVRDRESSRFFLRERETGVFT